MKLSKQLKSSKPLIVLTIVLLTLTTATSYAQSLQNWQFGLKAGANIFKLTGRSFDGKTHFGFNGGAYGEYKISNQWGIQPELLYSLVQSQTSADFNSIFGGVSYQNISLNYISVPVFLTFKPVPELSIMVGPQYDFLAAQTTHLYPQHPDTKAFSTSDFSIAFGGQLNLNKVKIGLRYVIGLVNVNGYNADSDQWKIHGLQAYLGFRIK
ncbi:MAG TPA: porin family protein [Puia sp.]|nr:porin family protein [Puia sp.]